MLRIEHLAEKDIPQVVEIENISFSNPKSEEIFKSDQNKYLVAREKEKIIGYIGIEKIVGESHIINMAVHPDARRKGSGQKLLEEILNDKDVFFLEVRVSNDAAIKLYEKYGFKKAGKRMNYYADNNEDAYLMRRNPK